MKISVQHDDFDVSTESLRLTESNPAIGAVVSFVGHVRDTSHNQNLVDMTLEHYPGMTEKQLSEIAVEAQKRWHLEDLTIIHRVGALKPTEQIVLVITASSHRQDAFEAAQFLMDWLKTKAPFWKKETTKDGQSQWVEALDSDNDAANKWINPKT